MKQVLPFLLIILLVSCAKDVEDFTEIKNEIAGAWEYETYAGYPFNNTVLPPGNGNIIVIHKNGTFERKQHDTLLFSGFYELERKKDCYQRSTDILFSSNVPLYTAGHYVEVKNEKLTLTTPNCMMDGGTAYYRRIR